MRRYYIESRRRGISCIPKKERGIIGFITF
jgi:hypothetical protein